MLWKIDIATLNDPFTQIRANSFKGKTNPDSSVAASNFGHITKSNTGRKFGRVTKSDVGDTSWSVPSLFEIKTFKPAQSNLANTGQVVKWTKRALGIVQKRNSLPILVKC